MYLHKYNQTCKGNEESKADKGEERRHKGEAVEKQDHGNYICFQQTSLSAI